MVKDQDDNVMLNDVDREILYELQQDARRTTHEEISAKVKVSQSAVRNRINALGTAGVITVQEMVTSERNLLVEVIATSSQDLTEITRELGNLHPEIHTPEIITNTFHQPFNYFEHSRSRPEVSADVTIEHAPPADQE